MEFVADILNTLDFGFCYFFFYCPFTWALIGGGEEKEGKHSLLKNNNICKKKLWFFQVSTIEAHQNYCINIYLIVCPIELTTIVAEMGWDFDVRISILKIYIIRFSI